VPLKIQDEDLFEYVGFRGLRNNVGPQGFEPGDLEVGMNADIDDALFIHRRKGHSAPTVSGLCHSLWASGGVCLVVRNDVLTRVNPDFTLATLRSGMASRPVSYAAIGGRVYYSNGVENGVVEGQQHRTWGLEVPAAFAATVTGGGLRAGRYQYTATYMRQDNQESGARRAEVVELVATSGFDLALIPSADPGVDRIAVYISDRDGETLFRHAVVPNAAGTLAVRELRVPLGPHLETQFLLYPPLGAPIAYANGRMLVAAGNRLFPSEPYAPELFDWRKSVPFLSKITLVAPLEDGTWLGTEDQVIWLPNAEPEKWDFRVRAEYGVVPGTVAYADGELIGDGSQKSQAVFFFTAQGPCAGLPGGQLMNFTQERYSPPKMQQGAGIVRRHRGIAQYVATLQGVVTAGNVAS
jgi:hypothetical protein